MVASVTRMTAHRWLVKARIDLGEARLQYLAKMQLQYEQASQPDQPRITAKERRRQTLGAVKRLNDAQTRRKGAKQGP